MIAQKFPHSTVVDGITVHESDFVLQSVSYTFFGHAPILRPPLFWWAKIFLIQYGSLGVNSVYLTLSNSGTSLHWHAPAFVWSLKIQ